MRFFNAFALTPDGFTDVETMRQVAEFIFAMDSNLTPIVGQQVTLTAQNFVQAAADGAFRYRTYERGVEAETLACGTGAVAIAVLLSDWGLARSPIRLTTRSGRALQVRLSGPSESAKPSLSGEARLVYRGQLGELLPASV